MSASLVAVTLAFASMSYVDVHELDRCDAIHKAPVALVIEDKPESALLVDVLTMRLEKRCAIVFPVTHDAAGMQRALDVGAEYVVVARVHGPPLRRVDDFVPDVFVLSVNARGLAIGRPAPLVDVHTKRPSFGVDVESAWGRLEGSRHDPIANAADEIADAIADDLVEWPAPLEAP